MRPDETGNNVGPHGPKITQLESDESVAKFDPADQVDARERVLREVVRRRGQAKFRTSLVRAYGGSCAITGCTLVDILEAAHITPYLGPATNNVSNGMLLRADIHTLWDLGLIAVDPETMLVWVNSNVNDPYYRALNGGEIRVPSAHGDRPSNAALREQWESAQSDEPW